MNAISHFPGNSLPDGLVTLDPKGRIMGANSVFCEICGFNEGELIGASAFDFIPLEHCFRLQAGYQNLTDQKGSRLIAEIPLRHKEGQLLLVDVSVINLLHEPDISACVILIRDNTLNKKRNKLKWEAAILGAIENEKVMIAAELHDNINQLLIGSMIFIEAVIAKQSKSDTLLNRSKDFLKEAVEEIRNLATVISGNLVKKISLDSAVHKLATVLEQGKNVKVTLDIDENINCRLSTGQALHLYRIIQEQINNICRHAEASAVYLSLKSTSADIKLTIHDDGKGYDVSNAGLGFQNIEFRTQILGGRSTVLSEPGKGTLLKAVIPLENHAAN